MGLNLQLVNETTLPDGGPVSFRISGKRGIDIGRDAHLDWTLPDPTRFVSGKHCEIRYKDGAYWLHDVSRNGTLLNGADYRLQAPHRLRTGDRFRVGHYIVAVTVEGEEAAAEAGPPAATRPVPPSNYDELWVSQGAAPPPIDPQLLKAARQNAPVHSDFLDWATDIPAPFQPPAPSRPAPSSARAGTAPAPAALAGSDMDWAVGAPSRVPPPPPPPLPRPAPRRPDWETSSDSTPWDDAATAAADPLPRAEGEPVGAQATAEPAGAAAPQTFPSSALADASAATFVRELARATGLPEDVFAQKDPHDLAQQIGVVLRLVAENLMQLLTARQHAKRLARSSRHTMVQAVDNNPLKFCPAAPDALRIMFGPATTGYLNASRAIGQGFDDLKAHQLKTYSAMQHALTTLLADLDPHAVERTAVEGRGIADLLVSRKAKLWDAYAARWENKIGREGGGPIEAFMSYFAEAYDRDG